MGLFTVCNVDTSSSSKGSNCSDISRCSSGPCVVDMSRRHTCLYSDLGKKRPFAAQAQCVDSRHVRVQTSVVQTSLGTAQAVIDQTLPGAAQAFVVRHVKV
jgi:hypothetical protein